jgi:predicted dehydrogenase
MDQTGSMTRREFVRTGAVAAGAIAAPAVRAGGASPAERIAMAWIGCGGRGRQLLRTFGRFSDVAISAVCDVNAPRMDEARKALDSIGRPAAEAVADYRRILDRRDIDAVVIATCEHWHGLPFIEACRAGKAIYVEKPLSHTVVEGRRMVEEARRAGVLALMGTQQRGAPHFRKAVEIVRSGRLGRVLHVECWNYHHVGNRGGRPPDGPPPAGLDWERWLGPAPLVPFNPLRLSYSWWFDYGGGMMTNWAVHHVDIILWAMGPAAPRSASCAGGLLAADTASDAPDLIEASWEFPGWVLRYAYSGFSNFHRVQSRPHHHGILFLGDKGSMVLDRRGFEIYENGRPGAPVESENRAEDEDEAWQRRFVDCLRSGKPPEVTLEESHRATTACLIANIAYGVRRTVAWDAAREAIPGDAEAAARLARPRRKGYELPEAYSQGE